MTFYKVMNVFLRAGGVKSMHERSATALGHCCKCHINKVPYHIQMLSTSSSVWKRRKGSVTAEAASPVDKDKKDKSHKVIDVWKNITVNELAKAVNRPVDFVFEAILYVPNADVYDHPSSPIDDIQIAFAIAKKLGYKCKITAPPGRPQDEDIQDKIVDIQPRPIRQEDLLPRPPVVTIMGHVDHGKTTLLDALRNSNIVSTEAGGITQHIGAFQVAVNSGKITFLDTPGHAAFSALRNRGAQVTDMVILVVAADDGVMEQTRESLAMIKAANVPIIVAINKIDRGNADVERTKKSLLREGIQLEEHGGDVQAVQISALKGTNLSLLMDSIILQAEMMNLKSEYKGMVEGVVIESSIDHGRGKLSTALIQRGVLRKSAIIVAGTAWAKVRGLFDEHGHILTKAEPSTPVEIIGWRELPSAGDKIFEVESEKRAKEIVNYRESLKMSEKQLQDAEAADVKLSEHLKDYKVALAAKRKAGRRKIRRVGPRGKEIMEDNTTKIALVIKGDVDGSVEAFLDVLDTYDCHNDCRLDIIHYGVGDITESDINLAEMFSAYIYGFNISMPANLESECKQRRIEYRISNIIYRLVESLKEDLKTKLPPKYEEEILGEANVLAVFQVTEGKKKIPVAGSRCVKGVLRRNESFRLMRGSEILFDGTLTSMKHEKNDVESIKNGLECGLGLSDATITPKKGDTILCYHMVEVPQTTEWDPGF